MRLVPVEHAPFNAETPMEALADPATPNALFYVRSHYDVPSLVQMLGDWSSTAT